MYDIEVALHYLPDNKSIEAITVTLGDSKVAIRMSIKVWIALNKKMHILLLDNGTALEASVESRFAVIGADRKRALVFIVDHTTILSLLEWEIDNEPSKEQIRETLHYIQSCIDRGQSFEIIEVIDETVRKTRDYNAIINSKPIWENRN